MAAVASKQFNKASLTIFLQAGLQAALNPKPASVSDGALPNEAPVAAVAGIAAQFSAQGGMFSSPQVSGGFPHGVAGLSEIQEGPIGDNSTSEQPVQVMQGVKPSNGFVRSNAPLEIQAASLITVTSNLKKQCQAALHQSLQLAMLCFKHRHNPMALGILGNNISLDLCDQIKKCWAVVNTVDGAEIDLNTIPAHAAIKQFYVFYGLYHPLVNFRFQTLQATSDLVTIASDVRRYLYAFVDADSTWPSQLQVAIDNLKTQSNTINQNLGSIGGCFGSQHRKLLSQVNSISFLNPCYALIGLLAVVQNFLNEGGKPNQFEIVRKFGQFPDALAKYMLHHVAVVTCLTDPRTQGLFGSGMDKMGLPSYSHAILNLLDFSVRNQALPAYFAGNFRFAVDGDHFQQDESGNFLMVENNDEHKAFIAIMNNLQTLETIPSKDLRKLFYKSMSQFINNNQITSFFSQDGSVPKVLSKEIERTPMQNVLQNLLFSWKVDNTKNIKRRPFTAKQLIMLSCISTKAFATALFLQAEHMLGEGGLQCQHLPENPPHTYDTAQQQLVNYIYALHRSVNQNS